MYNRSSSKTDDAVRRAKKEGALGAEPPRATLRACPRAVRTTARAARAHAHCPPAAPGLDAKLTGYHDLKDFVHSLQKPRCAPTRRDAPAAAAAAQLVVHRMSEPLELRGLTRGAAAWRCAAL